MNKQYLFLLLTIFFFSQSALSQAPSYIPTDSLVGWYPFSASPNDESGNGNHGTRLGASLVNDRHGNANSAYSFDGLNEYISIHSITNMDFGQSYTQSCWIFLNNTDGGGPIASKRPWAYPKIVHQSNKVQFYADASGHTNAVIAETGSINPNTWYHFTFVKDSNSYLLYMNGVLADSVYDSHYISGSSTAVYRIGAHSPDYPFKGIIDDFAIWNRALDHSEIAVLHSSCETITSTQEVSSCGPYTWTNGQVYTTNNNRAKDTFQTASGCDSVVTLNLSITNVDSFITEQPNNQSVTLGTDAQFIAKSQHSQATYQWQTNLGVGFQDLSNALQYSGVITDTLTISSVSMANNNQPFKCIVSFNNCSDTSDVVSLTVLDNASIDEIKQTYSYAVYPNPVGSEATLRADLRLIGKTYYVYTLNGQLISESEITSPNTLINLKDFEASVYLLKVDGEHSIRIIKE
ncbi:T9SS type A sorting domain-containing protein [Bacteroidia bacterium]|nr:T9SS type A sorting domain-containing protein [Bacteroidia bacterium]MDB4107678.1 T9SS type A sorting domain-containing protein [Bacteroidia bacterium]